LYTDILIRMVLNSSNKELYSNVEFSTWLELNKLFKEEKYLIEKYLKPDLKTVEAGVNGGRILFEMQRMGFTNLAGFDYVPELIDRAIERDPSRSIDFQVGDASDLTYSDCSFEQIVYLQQIICLIEQAPNRLQALRESHRILKPGGIGLFSFLSFESRSSNSIYSSYFAYLSALRKLRGEDLSIQYLPWMKLGGKFNFNSLLDRSPYTYWYRVAEIYNTLKSVGFEIVAIGTEAQIGADNLQVTVQELATQELSGMLYVVVKKP
jgi:ubiquinone/menaquinone biosynthesis C-methylase UbiE